MFCALMWKTLQTTERTMVELKSHIDIQPEHSGMLQNLLEQ